MRGKTLHLYGSGDEAEHLAVFKALASPTRLAILELLGSGSMPIGRIATEMGLPASTAAMHVAVLEKAGLIRTDMTPASRGLQKVCTRKYDEIAIQIPRQDSSVHSRSEISMPVGAYSDFDVEPTCGLAGVNGLIGYIDDPASFYEPEHLAAQLIWFRRGFVEYRFPNRVPATARLTSVQLSAELCSEAPLHDDDYPSDITLSVNGVELGTWTSPGDFGGERGRLTPDWWEVGDSQYGLLKRWRVSAEGTSLDGVRFSEVTLEDLHLNPREPVRIVLSVERDAPHVGGINLFGRQFGNYPQDLVLAIDYVPAEGEAADDRPQPVLVAAAR
jgi:predicted transcriptional regulator